MEKLGKIFRETRLKRNLSTYNVGIDIKVDGSILRKIENGEAKQLSLNTYLKFCRYYALDPIEVLKEVFPNT